MDRRRFLKTLSLPAIAPLASHQCPAYASTGRKVVIGLDTNGPDPAGGHRLVEIAAVEIIGQQISGSSFRSYLRPEQDFSGLDDKPPFSSIAHELAGFLGSDTLILYGARHHLSFLRHEFLIAGHGFALARAVIDLYELTNWEEFSHDFLGNLFAPIDLDPDGNTLAFREAIWVARLYLGMTA